jgi:hypothetical protein
MTIYLFIFLALLVLLVGFAVYMRDNVRASFSFKPFGFSLEAKNDNETRNHEK